MQEQFGSFLQVAHHSHKGWMLDHTAISTGNKYVYICMKKVEIKTALHLWSC